MCKLGHIKQHREGLYIGRPGLFGNPWSHKSGTSQFLTETRQESIDNFAAWLVGIRYQNVAQIQRENILRLLPQIKGKMLLCWCYPLPCHGEVLIALSKTEKWGKKMSDENEIELFCDVKAESDQALKCDFGDVEKWVPKSIIVDFDPNIVNEGYLGLITLPEWWAIQKGLL